MFPPHSVHRGRPPGSGPTRDRPAATVLIAGKPDPYPTLLEELLALGCELKNVQMGLVDFRALREERMVYLCWRLGEEEIRFWHELDTGFAGRQPL